MLIVGTRAHLEDLDRSYTYAVDVAVTAVAVGTSYGGVGSLLPGAARPTWCLLDGERIVLLDEFDMTLVTRFAEPSAQSLAAGPTGTLLVGLDGAHLLTVSPDGTVGPVTAFDEVPGRNGWGNPAAALPELRSIAISGNDTWYVNVHVGGLWRSTDKGQSWDNVVPAESDVHEVVTGESGTVAVAAAIGFGWSTDGGDTWSWSTDGLHASYARAVALDGETAYLTASSGPAASDGRVFRCRLGESFEQCSAGLADPFPYNLDTGSLAAEGGNVALGTRHGQVFRSPDSGATWDLAGDGMRPVRVVRFA
jgi:photosystem II stability/assembly factor-like uncharacterized protein